MEKSDNRKIKTLEGGGLSGCFNMSPIRSIIYIIIGRYIPRVYL